MEIWTPPDCVHFGGQVLLLLFFVKCGFGKGSKRMQALNLRLAARRGAWVGFVLHFTSHNYWYMVRAPGAFPSIRSTMALNLRDLPGEQHEFNEHGN